MARILIVANKEKDRELVQAALADGGHQIDVAEGLRSSITQMQHNTYDLIISGEQYADDQTFFDLHDFVTSTHRNPRLVLLLDKGSKEESEVAKKLPADAQVSFILSSDWRTKKIKPALEAILAAPPPSQSPDKDSGPDYDSPRWSKR